MSDTQGTRTEDSTIPNFMLVLEKGTPDLDIFLGNTWVTGPALVGDRIRDIATGREFEVTKRTWLSGRNRSVNVVLQAKEVEPDPITQKIS